MYMYVCVCVYIYIYIYKNPKLKLCSSAALTIWSNSCFLKKNCLNPSISIVKRHSSKVQKVSRPLLMVNEETVVVSCRKF